MVRVGIKKMCARLGVRTSHTIHVTACILASIAKHYAHLPEDDLVELRVMCRRLRPPERGMTAKNRRRLRQLDDPHVMEHARAMESSASCNELFDDANITSVLIEQRPASRSARRKADQKRGRPAPTLVPTRERGQKFPPGRKSHARWRKHIE